MKFFNEIFVSLKQCGLNYDFVYKINSSDRQNYQTIMFDNKVLIRINKSKLTYFYSNWNVFNVINMNTMFFYSNFNNDSLKNWNVSNVQYMIGMFNNSNFDKDVSSWRFNKNIRVYDMFSQNFIDKYNYGKDIPYDTKKFLKWFDENKNRIKNINTPKEEVLDFFSFDNKEINLSN